MLVPGILPALSWPGGKRLLAKHLIPLFPDHHAYIEVFGGGLALLLKKERSKIEVVNDLNSDLVTFYRVVRYHRDALLDELEFVPNSREEFNAYVAQPGLTDIQRAARFFIRNKLSFGAKGHHFGTSKKSGGTAHGSRANRLDAVRRLNERLDRVCIEHLDWRTLIDRYDAAATFFYLDPPYTSGMQYTETSGGEALYWTEQDHRDLRERLRTLEGTWLLSYDDSLLVRELYDGCRITPVSRRNGIGNNHASLKRTYDELIIRPA